MLKITIPSTELWNEKEEVFQYTKEYSLTLEHSLVSLSKWESKWQKPFLNPKKEKTIEETIDYIRCMTLTQNVDPKCYDYLTNENLREINDYIDAPMTATVFFEDKNKFIGPRETITSELIYYWMIALNIPMECQKWHLNRLFTLIKVCSIKNRPAKKRNSRETMRKYASMNAARRKKYNTRG